MGRRVCNLDVVLCLLCAAMVVGCPGDRMSQSTTEAVDDSLIANRVTLALYSDKEVHGRGIRVESAQGVVDIAPCGRTLEPSPLAQGPARCAVEA